MKIYKLWPALVVFMLDFISKQWIMMHLWLSKIKPIFSFINFTYVINSGGAFSFLADKGGWQFWLFSTISIVTIIALLIVVTRTVRLDNLSYIAYSMIIGGALGNLIDRIMHGVVIDFIDFHIGNWHWPIFNLADTSICIGVILIIVKNYYYAIFKTS